MIDFKFVLLFLWFDAFYKDIMFISHYDLQYYVFWSLSDIGGFVNIIFSAVTCLLACEHNSKQIRISYGPSLRDGAKVCFETLYSLKFCPLLRYRKCMKKKKYVVLLRYNLIYSAIYNRVRSVQIRPWYLCLMFIIIIGFVS